MIQNYSDITKTIQYKKSKVQQREPNLHESESPLSARLPIYNRLKGLIPGPKIPIKAPLKSEESSLSEGRELTVKSFRIANDEKK